MTYASILVTIDDVAGVNIATQTSGLVIPSLAADTTEFEFVSLRLDATTNYLEGILSTGSRISFAVGANVIVSIAEVV